VISVGEIAINIATLGASSGALNAADAATELTALRRKFKELKTLYQNSK